METREEKIARLERELAEAKAELEARWWEQDFTEDPGHSWLTSFGMSVPEWCRKKLPTIIRKREKVGVEIERTGLSFTGSIFRIRGGVTSHEISCSIAERLAGRPLAPSERVEI